MGCIFSESVNLKILITGQGEISLCFGPAFRCVWEVRESFVSEFIVEGWDIYTSHMINDPQVEKVT